MTLLIFLFLHFSPCIAEADDAVDDEMVCRRIGINDKIALAQELELITYVVRCQCLFSLAVVYIEAVGIDLVEEILAFPFFFAAIVLEEIIIDAGFDIDSIFGVDPVQRPFDLAVGVGTTAALAFRIIRAVQFDDVAVFILDDFFSLDDVRIFEADFLARSQAEEFLDRFFHEVIAFNVKVLAERHFTRAHGFIFLVVVGCHRFRLAVGIVGEDDLDRVDDRHQARCF